MSFLSLDEGDEGWATLDSGDAVRVEGSEGTSMSITMLADRRLKWEGCNGLLGNTGLPGKGATTSACSDALLIMEDVGLSNDQDLTTSTARAWQPLKNKKESAQMTLLRQSLTHATKHSSSLQHEIEFGPARDFACALCGLQRFLLQLSEKQS